MKFISFIPILMLLAGCAADDVRLHGTWKSNREATVAAMFQKNPSLTNLPPENIERLRNLYGNMTVNYSNGIATSCLSGKTNSWHYHVIERGDDFIVLRSEIVGLENSRIRFVDQGKSYWIGGPNKYEERFDKVESK